MIKTEILDRGMTCLLQGVCALETERFISVLDQKQFDDTKWQRERFDNVSSDDFYNAAVEYERNNPF